MPAENQNIKLERYQFVPRVLIFAIREEQILLIKGSPDKKIWPNLYNGVGGHVEQGETIISAARREFLEETGLELILPQLCTFVSIDTGQSPGIAMFVFIGAAQNGIPKPSSEGALEWVSLGELNHLPAVDDLKVLIPISLKNYEDNTIGLGHYAYDVNGKMLIEFDEAIK